MGTVFPLPLSAVSPEPIGAWPVPDLVEPTANSPHLLAAPFLSGPPGASQLGCLWKHFTQCLLNAGFIVFDWDQNDVG